MPSQYTLTKDNFAYSRFWRNLTHFHALNWDFESFHPAEYQSFRNKKLKPSKFMEILLNMHLSTYIFFIKSLRILYVVMGFPF